MISGFLGNLGATAARRLAAAPSLRCEAHCSDQLIFSTSCFCATAGKTSAAAPSLWLFIKCQFSGSIQGRVESIFRERLTRIIEKKWRDSDKKKIRERSNFLVLEILL